MVCGELGWGVIGARWLCFLVSHRRRSSRRCYRTGIRVEPMVLVPGTVVADLEEPGSSHWSWCPTPLVADLGNRRGPRRRAAIPQKGTSHRVRKDDHELRPRQSRPTPCGGCRGCRRCFLAVLRNSEMGLYIYMCIAVYRGAKQSPASPAPLPILGAVKSDANIGIHHRIPGLNRPDAGIPTPGGGVVVALRFHQGCEVRLLRG
jgi:hypothetical protein